MSDTSDEFLYHFVGWPFVNAKARHIAVAVSGGSDSLALLLLMQRWARDSDARLSAVTVDHGLRAEAVEEAAMVARVCADRGIAHDTLEWRGWDGKGNLQAAAREARYRLMAQWAEDKGVEAVCLGHTRNDQAETFLMRLARKSGSDGLKGMSDRFERHGVRWVRPVLSVERADLRGFLQRQGVVWTDDPSNDDAGFERIRARKVLEALAPLGIDAETLGAVANKLGMENGLLRQAVRAAFDGKIQEFHGALSIRLKDFRLQCPDAQRRLLNAAIGWIAGGDYTPRALSVDHFLSALCAQEAHTLSGVIGWVSKGRVWLAREYEPVRQMTGNPFDGRWQIDGPSEGTEIRALGPEGLKQLPDWRALGLPRRVFLPIPGVWRGDKLIAAPHVGQEKRHVATLLRPSFDKWL